MPVVDNLNRLFLHLSRFDVYARAVVYLLIDFRCIAQRVFEYFYYRHTRLPSKIINAFFPTVLCRPSLGFACVYFAASVRCVWCVWAVLCGRYAIEGDTEICIILLSHVAYAMYDSRKRAIGVE